jgi:hypothetical protein
MSFAERVKTKPNTVTTLTQLLETLKGEERDAVLSMLLNPAWTINELTAEFRAEGYRFGKDQFSIWRRANGVVRR